MSHSAAFIITILPRLLLSVAVTVVLCTNSCCVQALCCWQEGTRLFCPKCFSCWLPRCCWSMPQRSEKLPSGTFCIWSSHCALPFYSGFTFLGCVLAEKSDCPIIFCHRLDFICSDLSIFCLHCGHLQLQSLPEVTVTWTTVWMQAMRSRFPLLLCNDALSNDLIAKNK